ncbi:hypothetical protein A2880_01025 [Candidatus Peribacteria bacterium RIFCSPHIGHO2_01_FULL_49_38]|nr:MAG: hypothetical protein A2880_01025 [Candidatus Peribacteria bacterium RIFCSPHIGHO2_01_FULL_49_38]
MSIMAIVSLILPDLAFAAKRYWVVGSSANIQEWFDIENWSTAEGGTGGGSVPGAADVAIFDGKAASGHTITLRGAITVGGLIMTPSWTGSIFTGTSTLIIGGSGARIGSGRLVIGTGAKLGMSGSLIMSGGVISNSLANHRWSTSGSLKHTGGKFYYSGTILFNNTTGDQTLAFAYIPESATHALVANSFSGIILNNTAGTTIDDLLISGSKLRLKGSLTVTRGNFALSHSSATLAISGAITIADHAQSTFSSNANVTISGSIKTGSAGSYTQSGDSLLTLNGGLGKRGQVLDTNNAKITALTVTRTSSGVLAGKLTILGTITINTGSLLAMSGHTLYATGAKIVNYGTIKDDTGVLSHSGSAFVVGDSSYARLETFREDETIYITLTDSDENIDGSVKDTVTVTVTLSKDGTAIDTETVTLTETEKESGIFRGSILTANGAASTDGKLQHTKDGDVSVSYTDAQDGLINASSAVFLVTGGSSTNATGGSGGGGGGRRGSGVASSRSASPAVSTARERPSLRTVEQEARSTVQPSRGRAEMTFEDRIWSIVDRLEERMQARGLSQAEISAKITKLENRLQGVIDRRNERLKKRGL